MPLPANPQSPAAAAPPVFRLGSIAPLTWVLLACFAAIIYYAFRVPLIQMVVRWNEHDSYYSHGFLVPFVALYLLWRQRSELAALPRRNFWPGFVVLLIGLFLFAVSGFFSVFFLGALAFVITLWGLSGALFGAPFMARMAFPAFVLLFMVPLPTVWIEGISLRMKLFAAHAAVLLMRACGMPVVDDGSTIYLNDAVVQVGAACSGLRSLISLIFLGVLVAYLVELSFIRKVLLVLASVPIAVAANVVRVLFLSVVANEWGTNKIKVGGLIHDGSGYLVFIVAFALLWGTVQLLSIRRKAPPSAPAPPATPPAEPQHV